MKIVSFFFYILMMLIYSIYVSYVELCYLLNRIDCESATATSVLRMKSNLVYVCVRACVIYLLKMYIYMYQIKKEKSGIFQIFFLDMLLPINSRNI